MKVEEIIIGTPVIYYSVVKSNGEKFGSKETFIDSEPAKLGHGEDVCKLRGMSGYFAITHIEKR